jgi:hypothetical protein
LIGQRCTITRTTLSHSMVGNRAVVRGFTGRLSVTDDSEIVGGA